MCWQHTWRIDDILLFRVTSPLFKRSSVPVNSCIWSRVSTFMLSYSSFDRSFLKGTKRKEIHEKNSGHWSQKKRPKLIVDWSRLIWAIFWLQWPLLFTSENNVFSDKKNNFIVVSAPINWNWEIVYIIVLILHNVLTPPESQLQMNLYNR